MSEQCSFPFEPPATPAQDLTHMLWEGKAQVLMADPSPEGWKYGFPRELPEDVYTRAREGAVVQWLIDNGYPEELAEGCVMRFWLKAKAD